MNNLGVIYARVSREDQTKLENTSDSRSINNQIKVLSNYSKENNIKLINIFVDDGYSGNSLNRPGLNDLLKSAYQHKFNILLIKDISRLGRVMYQVATLLEIIFPENDIRVISLNDNYDSSICFDESIILKNFLNDYYLKDFKRKCKLSLLNKVNSKHLNYYPKYGYYYDKNKKEYIDKYASRIVEDIFEYAKENKTPKEIADILNEHKILTRSKYMVEILKNKPLHKTLSNKWTAKMVLDILKDYEYCGHSINLVRSNSKVIIKNTHQAIIKEELFKVVNDKIKSRLITKNKIIHLGNILKDNIFYKNFSYNQSKGKNDDYYYSKILHLSINKTFIHLLLYNEVINYLIYYVNNSDIIKEITKRKYLKNNFICFDEANIKLEEVNNKYSKLIDDYLNNKIFKNIFDSKSKEYQKEINEIDNYINNCDYYRTIINSYKFKFLSFLDKLKEKTNFDIELIKSVIIKVIFIKNLEKKVIEIMINFI